MNSNFSFIQPSFPQIFSDAADTEELALLLEMKLVYVVKGCVFLRLMSNYRFYC